MKRASMIVLLLFVVLSPVPASHSAPLARPKLVVGVVIDQFRYDYLERFADLFGEDGFQRLMREGAVFPDAQQLHSVTVTAPGHATFRTGSSLCSRVFPRRSLRSLTETPTCNRLHAVPCVGGSMTSVNRAKCLGVLLFAVAMLYGVEAFGQTADLSGEYANLTHEDAMERAGG